MKCEEIKPGMIFVNIILFSQKSIDFKKDGWFLIYQINEVSKKGLRTTILEIKYGQLYIYHKIIKPEDCEIKFGTSSNKISKRKLIGSILK